MTKSGKLSSFKTYYNLKLIISGNIENIYMLSLMFAIPPWAPEVAVSSDQWNGGVLFVPFAHYYFNSPDSSIICDWPICLEWASIGTAIAPKGSH